jgi:4-alpha-glucanotransferase
MNLPGTAGGNWRWRVTEEMLAPSVFDRLRDLTSASGRRPNLVNANRPETIAA